MLDNAALYIKIRANGAINITGCNVNNIFNEDAADIELDTERTLKYLNPNLG